MARTSILTLGVGTTDANGRVSFQTRLLKPTWYRAGFAETALSNGAVSGVRYVAPLAPTLVLDSVSPTVVDYGGTVTVRGRLLGAGSAAITGSNLVELWVKPYGGSWKKASNASWSPALSRYVATTNPAIRSQLQLRFPANPPSTSAEATVKARAKVGTPYASSTMARTKYYTVYGYLYPKHASGASAITLTFKRLSGSKWVPKKTVTAKVKDYATDRSKYSARVKLTMTGKWRVYATHKDTGHESKTSSYRSVRVK